MRSSHDESKQRNDSKTAEKRNDSSDLPASRGKSSRMKVQKTQPPDSKRARKMITEPRKKKDKEFKAPATIPKPDKIHTQVGESSPIEPREESSVSVSKFQKQPTSLAIRVDEEDASSIKQSSFSKPPTITPMSHVDNRSESKTQKSSITNTLSKADTAKRDEYNKKRLLAQVQRERNIARAKAEVEAQQQRIDRTNNIVKENMEDADGSKALQNVINQVQENFRLE